MNPITCRPTYKNRFKFRGIVLKFRGIVASAENFGIYNLHHENEAFRKITPINENCVLVWIQQEN